MGCGGDIGRGVVVDDVERGAVVIVDWDLVVLGGVLDLGRVDVDPKAWP